MDGQPSPSLPRYCTKCGEIFDALAEACPECRTRWPRMLPINKVEAYTLLLTEIGESRRLGSIDEETYQLLRKVYEARLVETRPARRFAPRPEPVRAALSGAAAAMGATPARPSTSPFASRAGDPNRSRPIASGVPTARPANRTLPIAPSVPTAGPAFGNAAKPPRPPRDNITPIKQWAVRRQADLVLYLGAFLLSVAALIFVDYQGGVLTGLAKSAILGTYTVLFLAFGVALHRWERVREAGPVFVALGAILTPLNFLLLYTGTMRGGDTPQAWLWLGGSVATAGLYTLLAARGFGRFYAIPAAIAGVVAWGSLGATVHLPLAWYGAWYLVPNLAVLQFAETRALRPRSWVEGLAGAIGIAAIAWAHLFAVDADAFVERLGLSATYALLFAGALTVVGVRRNGVASGLLPVTSVMAVASLAWAVPASHEWATAWAAIWPPLMAGGYAGLALFDRRHEMAWFVGSAGLALFGVCLAHVHAAENSAVGDRLELSAVYLLVFAGAAVVAGRRRNEVAFGVLPFAGVMSVAALAWAIPRSSDFAFAWGSIWPMTMAAGYVWLALANRTREITWFVPAGMLAAFALMLAHADVTMAGSVAERLVLATVYAMVTAGALTVAIRRPTPLASGLLPVTGVMSVAALTWALPAGREFALTWASAWPVFVAAGYLVVALVDPKRSAEWCMAGLVSGALALTLAHVAVADRDLPERLPVIYGATLLLAAGAFGRWQFPLALGLTPSLAALTLVSALWATERYAFEWSGVALIATALGYVALTLVQPRTREAWRSIAFLGAGVGLGVAHLAAGTPEAIVWQLPTAYALILLGAAADSLINREAAPLLFVPVALGGFGASLLWAAGVPPEWWAAPALGVAGALTVAGPLTARSFILERGRWPYALAMALAPLASFAAYAEAPMVGAGALVASGAIFLAAALFARGPFVRLAGYDQPHLVRVEEQMLARIAAAFVFGAAGYVAHWLDLTAAEAAYIYAGAGIAALLAMPVLRTRVPASEGVLAPIGVTGVLLGTLMAYEGPGQVALMLGAATVAFGTATGGKYPSAWRTITYISGGWALIVAHEHAGAVITPSDAWELPVAYAAVLLAVVADTAINRFRPGLLLTPLSATMTGAATLWAFDLQPEHWAWAPLTLSALVIGTDRAWRREDPVSGVAYFIALGLAVIPVFFVSEYKDVPFVGAAQLAAGSALWLLASLRTRGALASLLDVVGARTVLQERVMVQIVAAALALASVGHLNFGFDLAVQASSWVFAVLGLAGYVAVAAMGQRVRGSAATLMPIATAALLLGVGPSEPGDSAAMLGLGALAAFGSYRGTREPMTFLLGSVYAAAALGLLWGHQDWPAWSLGLAYGVAAAALNIGLVPLRSLGGRRGRDVVMVLSSVPGLLPVPIVIVALVDRVQRLDGASALATAEWRALVAVVGLLALSLGNEAWARRSRALAYVGALVGLLAVEMGIASFEPANVQWFTAPIAAFLLGLGLSFRSSPEIVSRHLFAHELLFLAAAAMLFLPQAEQSFEPGGSVWAIVVLTEALAMLALGVTLGQRWIVVSSVLATVGVAGRFFTSGEAQVPYWVSLGLAGLVLLGVGMLLLLARDWWDRTRERLGRWWVESPVAG